MSAYHPGELDVQKRAGVHSQAARIANAIHREIPAAAAQFLRHSRWVVAGTTDDAGRPWASIVAGPEGFIEVVTPTTIRVTPTHLDDRFGSTLLTSSAIGLVIVDPATRRRARVNGGLEAVTGAAFTVAVDQVYANCPKYIQRREWGGEWSHPPLPSTRSRAIGTSQRDLIHRSDTFFIATNAPGYGSDASHRGGMPGFVETTATTIEWDDYAGNTMFNTLGNIAIDRRAGVIFIDYATGTTLQVTGAARVDWPPPNQTEHAERPRRVVITVDEVAETAHGFPYRLRRLDYSPHNPAVAKATSLRGEERKKSRL